MDTDIEPIPPAQDPKAPEAPEAPEDPIPFSPAGAAWGTVTHWTILDSVDDV